jgi:ABC-2 type transport system ATP-binding protein
VTSPVVVRTEGLTKRYPGGLLAVDHLGLEVHEGDLFGFLGPNGAGKSTTIRMMLGLVFPTAGTVEVLGQPIPRHSEDVLSEVGALVEGPGFYPHLSGRRNLTLFDAAGRNGVRATRTRRIDDVLERVGLADVGRRPVRAYSMGMRQRLGLAAALLRHPRLLILDEPTNGLDPQGIHELRTMFVDLVNEGTTVFLSSHLLSEVELICTRAAMMANGRLVAQDRVEALLAPTGVLRIESPDASEAAKILSDRQLPVEWLDQTHLRVHLNGQPAEEINTMLVNKGVRIRELARERPTLEDVFLGLTGSGAVPDEQPEEQP